MEPAAMTMTSDDLIAFSEEIAALFNAGSIPYPVHLSDGNEDALISIFEDVNEGDYVFGSWRMHYHALLKGVSRETLKEAIMRGESMALRFPGERVYGSAIVGGCVPIALGVALAVKRRGGAEQVWCFVGDMTARAGIFSESLRYAENFDLPIKFVIEDNGVSVCTDTALAWGGVLGVDVNRKVSGYTYHSRYPHAGAGQRVQF